MLRKESPTLQHDFKEAQTGKLSNYPFSHTNSETQTNHRPEKHAHTL